MYMYMYMCAGASTMHGHSWLVGAQLAISDGYNLLYMCSISLCPVYVQEQRYRSQYYR